MPTNLDDDLIYTQQLAKLRTMIASTPGLQRQLELPVDPASIDAALAHVVPPVRSEELRNMLPAVVVEVAPMLTIGVDAAGVQYEMTDARGSFRVLIADNERSEDLAASYQDFLAFAGAVLSGLANLSALDDNLAISNMTQETEPLLSDEIESAGQSWWLTTWIITWGDD